MWAIVTVLSRPPLLVVNKPDLEKVTYPLDGARCNTQSHCPTMLIIASIFESSH